MYLFNTPTPCSPNWVQFHTGKAHQNVYSTTHFESRMVFTFHTMLSLFLLLKSGVNLLSPFPICITPFFFLTPLPAGVTSAVVVVAERTTPPMWTSVTPVRAVATAATAAAAPDSSGCNSGSVLPSPAPPQRCRGRGVVPVPEIGISQ